MSRWRTEKVPSGYLVVAEGGYIIASCSDGEDARSIAQLPQLLELRHRVKKHTRALDGLTDEFGRLPLAGDCSGEEIAALDDNMEKWHENFNVIVEKLKKELND